MFCAHSRDCVTYNMSCDYIPRKQAGNLHESDILILYFTLVPGDETTSICFEAPTDRPCHLAKHTPAKQLAYNFSDGKMYFTPQSPLDWCEDPKPSWAIALRPQRKMQRHRTQPHVMHMAWPSRENLFVSRHSLAFVGYYGLLTKIFQEFSHNLSSAKACRSFWDWSNWISFGSWSEFGWK